MPSAYTKDLYDGEQTFPEFAMQCARAFGALIRMRDSARDAEISDALQPGSHHLKAKERAELELDAARLMSPEEAAAAAQKEYAREQEAWAVDQAESEARVERFTSMLHQVEAWEPPTPQHVEMKAFMVEQLKGSIKVDGVRLPAPTPPPDGEECRRKRIEQAERAIAHHKNEHAREVQQAEEATAWVRALRESLPFEDEQDA